MNNDRRQEALRVRIAAAELAAGRVHPRHVANGDEQKFRREDGTPSYLASFTKGLPHEYDTGLVCKSEDFQQFVKGIDSGDPRDFRETPLGPKGFSCHDTHCVCHCDCTVDKNNQSDDQGNCECHCDCKVEQNHKGDDKCLWKSEIAKTARKEGKDGEDEPAEVRAWESQGGGNTFDLEGPDAWAVTMPPAPALGSDELTAEMAEVYAQALLRDVPFTEIVKLPEEFTVTYNDEERIVKVQGIVDSLNQLKWFNDKDCCSLTPAEKSRRRKVNPETGLLDGQTVFRGITPGDDIGPYISQFLLVGNKGVNPEDKAHDPKDGYIAYGSVRIDQRMRVALKEDYMTTWDEWFDVQNGADLRGVEKYDEEDEKKYRFITTPRDLATYVHYDALYEAYLNACLILLGDKVPFDPGIPFQRPDFRDHQQGFAHFGGPHILSLVTEVATRALKAVRYQKFNVHRRMRPEVLAARLTRYKKLESTPTFKNSGLDVDDLKKMVDDNALQELLKMVEERNSGKDADHDPHNWLLPMAFPEGSPMHPSYGAGHATVAGACVTILKAFFDHGHPLTVAGDDKHAFIPHTDGSCLNRVKVEHGSLTVEGELNKLASNIAIGRDWAGVHYFSDYIESLRMGEQIAIGILEEQKLTYGENFSMTVPLYDGGSIRI
ncbi:MAG: bromoperoxidase [Candidatus Electrothrix sp. EH2]|nr:bromoperoxidase [Candidatus Electrothrix sp. EH2]